MSSVGVDMEIECSNHPDVDKYLGRAPIIEAFTRRDLFALQNPNARLTFDPGSQVHAMCSTRGHTFSFVMLL